MQLTNNIYSSNKNQLFKSRKYLWEESLDLNLYQECSLCNIQKILTIIFTLQNVHFYFFFYYNFSYTSKSVIKWNRKMPNQYEETKKTIYNITNQTQKPHTYD